VFEVDMVHSDEGLLESYKMGVNSDREQMKTSRCAVGYGRCLPAPLMKVNELARP
jgi:hypothetical protein